jgi:hypothetical protein
MAPVTHGKAYFGGCCVSATGWRLSLQQKWGLSLRNNQTAQHAHNAPGGRDRRCDFKNLDRDEARESVQVIAADSVVWKRRHMRARADDCVTASHEESYSYICYQGNFLCLESKPGRWGAVTLAPK